MFAALRLFLASLVLALVSAKTGADHPTLPTLWVATTIDPPEGKGVEAYNFVSVPTAQNPSTMWSNYTDCQRLIYVPGYSGTRYLLDCEGGLDCCYEYQDGNQVEFQIPNVYYADPRKKAEVSYARKNVTTFGNEVEADEWSWAFETPEGKAVEKFWAYTVDCKDCYLGVQLVAWKVQASVSQVFTIQFQDYRGVDPESPEAKDFVASFAIPKQCQANNLLQCPSGLHDKHFGNKRSVKV